MLDGCHNVLQQITKQISIPVRLSHERSLTTGALSCGEQLAFAHPEADYIHEGYVCLTHPVSKEIPMLWLSRHPRRLSRLAACKPLITIMRRTYSPLAYVQIHLPRGFSASSRTPVSLERGWLGSYFNFFIMLDFSGPSVQTPGTAIAEHCSP